MPEPRANTLSNRFSPAFQRSKMPTPTIAPPVRAEQTADSSDLTTLNDIELLDTVVNHYHNRFLESPQALKYLHACGITNTEVIEDFQIGFVDRTLGQRLPSHQVKAGSEIRKRLKSIGLLKKSGHERFRGCIVVPLFNEHKNIVQLYGQRIDNVSKRDSTHVWFEGPRSRLFNPQAFAVSDQLIVCGALFDALIFCNAGFKNVTTLPSLEYLTDEFMEALKCHNIQRLSLAFGSDDEVNAAFEKHTPEFKRLGIEVSRISLPRQDSPPADSRRDGPPADSSDRSEDQQSPSSVSVHEPHMSVGVHFLAARRRALRLSRRRCFLSALSLRSLTR